MKQGFWGAICETSLPEVSFCIRMENEKCFLLAFDALSIEETCKFSLSYYNLDSMKSLGVSSCFRKHILTLDVSNSFQFKGPIINKVFLATCKKIKETKKNNS